jgi:hypothetical protein
VQEPGPRMPMLSDECCGFRLSGMQEQVVYEADSFLGLQGATGCGLVGKADDACRFDARFIEKG